MQNRASSFDPCELSVFRKDGGAVGAFTTQLNNILGFGEQDVLSRTQTPPEERTGKLKRQESSLAHVGKAASWSTVTPRVWPARIPRPIRFPLKPLRPCGPLGSSYYPRMMSLVVNVNGGSFVGQRLSRLDNCARPARLASGVDSLQGGDVYCVNDLIKTALICPLRLSPGENPPKWGGNPEFPFAITAAIRRLL